MGGKKKAGHGMLDSEMPSEVRESKEGTFISFLFHSQLFHNWRTNLHIFPLLHTTAARRKRLEIQAKNL